VHYACCMLQVECCFQLQRHALIAVHMHVCGCCCRAMGVPATLDELYATDDPDPHTKLRTLAAAEERRRALRQLNSAAKAGHKHMPQGTAHWHTAAA
jgi:hypothetical protein